MPIQTDLSVSPYFDDYAESKNYYKVLFKPSVAVQVRELNQLQSILQGQVEKFGDSIYKRGSIIDGCNFTYADDLKYVRVRDNEVDGTPVNVSALKGLFLKDSDDLKAYVIETAAGFESQNPDLNTLFIRYTNGGSNYSKIAYDKNTIITAYDPNFPLVKARVIEGSSGFSNNDTLVVYPAIGVQNSTGGAFFAPNTWVINSKIVQETTGAEAEILAINSTANSEVLILNIRPLETDLDDAGFDANNWNLSSGYDITSATLGATVANSSANGLVVQVIGQDARGTLLTDGTGKITQVAISTTGSGYYVPPHITVASPTGAIESANIEAYNYQAKVTIQNDDAAIGNSYGVAVGPGVIYQKGYFSRVERQLAIVEKYANTTTPHEKYVGFNTIETLINSNDDQSLLDNALGSFNYTAPGADRVKLTPTLIVLDKIDAEADPEFLPLIEFNKGQPYKKIRGTQYSRLGIELAERTYNESGNYIIDRFNSVTASAEGEEDTSFNVVVDSGTGYILGNKVQTDLNYTETLNKGITTISSSNTTVDLNYGYYIRVNELGGYFQFNTGDVISLRNAALQYASNTSLAGTEPAAPGSEIGKARMKMMTYESGEPGSSAVYRIYLWNVQMNTGKNFSDVRGIYYDGASYKGYADIITDAGIAKIYDSSKSELIFETGFQAVKAANNLSYNYRSVNATSTANTAGVVNTSPVTGSWIYSGELTTTEQSELTIVPLTSFETANLGTASVGAGSTSNTRVVLANATFGAALSIGDYIKVYGTSDKIRKVTGITNATHITVDSGLGLTNASANVSFILPKYTPIQLASRPNRTANVNGSYLRIYTNPPANFVAGGDVAVSYNAKRTSIAPTSKNTFRNSLVKLNIGTHPSGVNGPWYLGVPDIFRLRSVYTSTSSTVNTNSTDITNEFFIDHNQTENSYDGGYLFKRPESTYTIGASDYLLVKFDAFDKTGGIYTKSSYKVVDSANLATISATATDINTLEIPEMYTSTGVYHDLIDVIDFRISANTTANIVTSATDVNITTNPTVPAYADRYNDADEKYFPVPQGDISFNVESYQGRTDRIILNANSDFIVLAGDQFKTSFPSEPTDALTINILNIPPYPSLPRFKSGELIEILNKSIANIKYTNRRDTLYSITENTNEGNIIYQQPRAYKMTDIASIERRLRNIENRVDLKEIEDEVNGLAIPSSVDGQTNRFKFGFFVDNFTTTDFTDLSDPEYSAMNFDYRLTGLKDQNNITFKPYTANTTFANSVIGDMITLPFEEYSIVRQLSATTTPLPPPPPDDGGDGDTGGGANTGGGGGGGTSNVVTAQQTSLFEYVSGPETAEFKAYNKIKNSSIEFPGPRYDFTFSANTGPASLLGASMYSQGGTRFVIYQGTTPGFAISDATVVRDTQSAVELSKAERSQLAAKSGGPGVFNNNVSNILTDTLRFRAGPLGPKQSIKKGIGKVSWTHDPTKGIYYSVIPYKIDKESFYGYILQYPVDAQVGSFIDTGVQADALLQKPYVQSRNPKYLTFSLKVHELLTNKGYVSIKATQYKQVESVAVYVDKSKDKIKLKKSDVIKYSFSSVGPNKITIEARGLRPLTRYDAYIDNVLSNSRIEAKSGPLGGTFGTDVVNTGSSIVTDTFGYVKFDVYPNTKLPTGVLQTTFGELSNILKNTSKIKYLVLTLPTVGPGSYLGQKGKARLKIDLLSGNRPIITGSKN
jgi:hypothetical protein